ncbi:bacterio-opsin activator domain-containing protein [Natrialbaceae archaeon A-chndr2]
MSTGSPRSTLVVASDESHLPSLESLESRWKHTVQHLTTLESLDETLEETQPDATVVLSSDPDWVRSALQRIETTDWKGTTVVAPSREGSESLATVALRHGANEYVPSSEIDDLNEQLGEMLTEDTESEDLSATVSSVDLTELLTTTLPDEVFVLDTDGRYLDTEIRPNAADLYTVSSEEFVGRTLWEAFPQSTADRLYSAIEAAHDTGTIQSIEYDAETTDGRRQFDGRVVPIENSPYGRPVVIWLARDITERHEREQALRQRRDHLESLNQINSVVRRIIRTLVEAPTQSAVEAAVCEQLVQSPLYCGAWISRPTGAGEITYQLGRGEVDSYLDEVRSLEHAGDRPITKAFEQNEIYSSNELQTESDIPERLQRIARQENIRSAIAVPLAHDDTVYGVLTVLARRGDAFGSRETETFKLLGETIGFAINGIKNRRLLFADAVTVLEFRIEGGNSFSFDLSKEHNCTVTLEWTGTTANGERYQYVTVDGLSGDCVYEAAQNHHSVETCRLIKDGDTKATIGIQLSESAVGTLTGYGATIRDIVVEDGVGHVTVEVSRDTNVREIVEAVTRVYERTELISKHDEDRSVSTAQDRRNHVRDRLTDRQLTALRLAYYGGYFNWPRGSTGEEIAESMGIAPPTMHQHLRKGLQEVLRDFFDDEDGSD